MQQHIRSASPKSLPVKTIKLGQLENLVSYLNSITRQPPATYSKRKGVLKANIGNYHLTQGYGGVCLSQVASPSGGTFDVFRCGHVSKRELYNRLYSYIQGYEAGNKTTTKTMNELSARQ